jgi:hypothetical protein
MGSTHGFPTAAQPTQQGRIDVDKLSDAELDQFVAPTSARTDRSMSFTKADVNRVVPGNERLM